MEGVLFTVQEFDSAILSAAQQLQFVQSELISITCPMLTTLSIDLQDLTLDSIGALLDEVPSGYRKDDKENDYVYIVRLVDVQKDVVQTLFERLEEARKTADDYCRVNRQNEKTDTLYVGRSKKLRSRLTQHLGTEQRGIYSMHLQRWATSVKVRISISFMKFENKDDLLVQAIEDGLWASLRPAFGRKGER